MYTGQVLRGIVHLRLTNEKTVRGIFLKISGKAKVSWTEGAGKGKRTYDGIEKYLYEQRILVAGTDGAYTLSSLFTLFSETDFALIVFFK